MALQLSTTKSSINFLGKKWIGFLLSAFLLCATLGLLAGKDLNYGIDFTGGILIEVKLPTTPDLASLRQSLTDHIKQDISLQQFGDGRMVMIRIGSGQINEQTEQIATINQVKQLLSDRYDEIDYRKVEYVGPKVGKELIQSGMLSLGLAFLAILAYIWLRFEWQFGVGAIIALCHDVIITIGFFCITQLEFNLTSIAAILTIIGYSINDSVVIFDRIQDNLRKYKKMDLLTLLNRSINDNILRTLLTSITTLLALSALVLVGGEVIKSFSMAAFFGVVIGTYSSVYIAAPILIFMKLR